MDGYTRITRQNPKWTFYHVLLSIMHDFSSLRKRFEKILEKKKIDSIQKKYPAFSIQIKRVLDHTATSDEVIRLYEVGVPLISDYIACLKKENFLTKECLDYLEKWASPQSGVSNSESDYCIVLDTILACYKKEFSSGWDVVSAYCLGFLSRENTLVEINKKGLHIPETIKLIKAKDKDILKIEEVYYKEVKN